MRPVLTKDFLHSLPGGFLHMDEGKRESSENHSGSHQASKNSTKEKLGEKGPGAWLFFFTNTKLSQTSTTFTTVYKPSTTFTNLLTCSEIIIRRTTHSQCLSFKKYLHKGIKPSVSKTTQFISNLIRTSRNLNDNQKVGLQHSLESRLIYFHNF